MSATERGLRHKEDGQAEERGGKEKKRTAIRKDTWSPSDPSVITSDSTEVRVETE